MTEGIAHHPSSVAPKDIAGVMTSLRTFRNGRFAGLTVALTDRVISCQTKDPEQIAQLEAAYLHQTQSRQPPLVRLRVTRKLVQRDGRRSALYDIQRVSIA